MRRGGKLSQPVLQVILFLCALVLVVALTGVAARMTAIISVLSSLFIFVFVPAFTQRSAAFAMRRVHRGRATRAPPLF